MDWTEIYRDMVSKPFVVEDRKWGYDSTTGAVKSCRTIPCPGSYFPAHDEQCEMVWDEENSGWVDCDCEPRARAVRDAVDGD